MSKGLWFLWGLAFGISSFCADSSLPSLPSVKEAGRYQFRKADPNGIGKFYMGREIAQVMGHQAADWLERPEREQEERTALLIDALKLRPGDVVADIGAGTGYHARRIAPKVLPGGKVYAVDIQAEMLTLLSNKMAELNITNVVVVQGTIDDPNLPFARAPAPTNGIDLVLMVDVYHELSHPFEMMQGICRSLKPGGRVVFVEFREEDPKVPIKAVHKMSEAQVRKEMSAQPLEWAETITTLPWQHIIVFKKKASR